MCLKIDFITECFITKDLCFEGLPMTTVRLCGFLQKWLSHDLDVAVSVEEVRRHKRQFLEDRKELTHQLQELKQRLEDTEGPSSSKVPHTTSFTQRSCSGHLVLVGLACWTFQSEECHMHWSPVISWSDTARFQIQHGKALDPK